MATVLIRKATEKTVKRVVEEIFDLFQVDVRGKRVLIKPNMLGAYPPQKGATTSPAVVRAIVEVCRNQTESIIVGDNPMRALAAGGLEETARTTGILAAAGGYYRNIGLNAEVVSIGSELVDEVPLTPVLKEIDYFINVPKFKTHMLCGITGCVKNLFGLIPGAMKAEMHYRLQHPKALTQFFVDLYSYRKPDLNIVDALTGMEGNGPSHGRVRSIGTIIAGTNGVEVDAVMAAMMGFEEPAKVKTLDIAHKRGLGAIELTEIEIDGELEVIPDFELPIAYVAPKEAPQVMSIEETYETWGKIGGAKPQLIEEKCVQCDACEEICPTGAMKVDPYPIVDEEKCISCFCCAENCPEGALVVPETAHLYESFFGG